MIATVCWHQHGGSGFTFTRADCLDMGWDEFCFYLEEAGERRKTEASAITRASQARPVR